MGFLKDETVTVKIRRFHIGQYYENLGYLIPKVKLNTDYTKRSGRTWGYDSKAEIVVRAEDLWPQSETKVSYLCDECGVLMYQKRFQLEANRHAGKNYCRKCGTKLFNSGQNHYKWKSDKTDEERNKDRSELPGYTKFMQSVMARDNHTCQCCNKKIDGDGEVHHIYSWDINKELRYDYSNCITLCINCHKNFHMNYGYGNNTKEQFETWLGQSLEYLKEFDGVLPTQKRIYCYETDTIYDSVDICAEALNVTVNNVYYACSQSKNHCSLKYHLFYYEDYVKLSESKIKEVTTYVYNSRSDKRIVLLNTKEVFNNSKDACIKYNIKIPTLSSHLIQKTKLGRFINNQRMIFLYYEDYSKLGDNEIDALLNEEKKFLIICITTGKAFYTNKEACEYAGISVRSMNYHLNHPDKSSFAGHLNRQPLVFMKYSDYQNATPEYLTKLLKVSEPFIICTTTGQYFYHYKEAADFYALSGISGIYNACTKKSKFAGKLPDGTPLKWMYYAEYLSETTKNLIS